jgi:hypothetical protein
VSTLDERPALIAWVRAALEQLDETSGPQPWADAENSEKEQGR